jgi:hypothetical protein
MGASPTSEARTARPRLTMDLEGYEVTRDHQLSHCWNRSRRELCRQGRPAASALGPTDRLVLLGPVKRELPRPRGPLAIVMCLDDAPARSPIRALVCRLRRAEAW